MKHFPTRQDFSEGFTLVELLITLVISGIIAVAIYSAYITQQRTYLAQDQVVEMQQNIRAGLMLLTKEIRMAGYDPTSLAGAGITTASAGQISFTQDITDNSSSGNPDGDVSDSGESIDYGFTPSTSAANYDVGRDGIPDVDSDGDGVPDAMPLGRQTGGAGGYQSIVENIQAIEFYYTLDNGTKALSVTGSNNLKRIKKVEISILARAGKPDSKFTNNTTYTTPSGARWGPYRDNYRRRLLTTTVYCRNMGL